MLRFKEAFKTDSFCLCGNVFNAKGMHISYRQIPINKIDHIEKISEGIFIIRIKKYDDFNDVQNLKSVFGKQREILIQKIKNIKNVEQITLNLLDLDKFFRKNKQQKQKQIEGFLKLFQKLKN